MKIQENKEVSALDQYLVDHVATHTGQVSPAFGYRGVAYFFTDAKGYVVSKRVYKTICFGKTLAEFASIPNAHFFVYVPRLREFSEKTCLTFLSTVVGKHHWFKDVIEDFDPEKIYRERRVVIDGTKHSFFHALSSVNMVRYLDELPEIIKLWEEKVMGGVWPNTWKSFFKCHQRAASEIYWLKWDHSLFQPIKWPHIRKIPKITAVGRYSAVPMKTFYPIPENFDDNLSLKKVFGKEKE